MDRTSLENQFFAWEGWDQMDIGDLQFHDVTLTVQVGEHAAGTKFPAAYLICSQSMLVLMDDKGEEFAYELKASVGDRLEPVAHDEHEACGCGHEH